MTPPTLAPATITEDENGITVTVKWQPQEGLDRLDCYGWGLPRTHRALAERLVHAVDAGVVVKPTAPYTDVNGNHGWHTSCAILARIMNADLHRLGF